MAIEITLSDTNPDNALVRITLPTLTICLPDGTTKDIPLPEGASVAFSEEVPIQDLAKQMVKIFSEYSQDALAHAAKQEIKNGIAKPE